MKYFFLCLALFLTGCSAESLTYTRMDFFAPAGWNYVEECKVSFYLPPEFKEDEKVRGGDSCYREYKTEDTLIGIDVLYFPSTKYSKKGFYSNRNQFHLKNALIEETPAEIITFTEDESKDGQKFMAILHIPQFIEGSSLNMWISSKTAEQRDHAMKMFQSVKKQKL